MWYHEHEDGVIIQVKVLTGARKNQIVGIIGDFLKIKISANPVKGRANQVLREFLAQLFRLSQRSVIIVKGELSQIKLIFLPIPEEQLLVYTAKNNIK